MTVTEKSALDLADLEQALKAADPAVLLIVPRLLRRVIKRDRGLTGFGLPVPHRKSYVVGRDAFLAAVSRREVGLADDDDLPAKVVLLSRPERGKLASQPAHAVLLHYWPLLFHARVHLILEDRIAEGKLTPARVRERIRHIGATEFDEVRAVLRQENYLLPPRNDLSAYVEFAAVYLELRHFSPSLLSRYFPTIHGYEAIDRVLAQDVDVEALFAATRPAGAPEPIVPAAPA